MQSLLERATLRGWFATRFRARARSAARCCASLAAGVALFAIAMPPDPASAQDGRRQPTTGRALSYELSVPVDQLTPRKKPSVPVVIPNRINPLAGEPDGGRRGTGTRPRPPLDPLVNRSQNRFGRTPKLDLKFGGTGNPVACGGCSPPDTIGDVGKNHYIQMLNATKVTIYDKTGKRLKKPFDLGDLWSSGPCMDNFGDPVVLYDERANRWLLAQFHGGGTNRLCFAISQTGNPKGAYHLYEFTTTKFPDYFKVGVWRNGYYVSANEISAPDFYTAYAFNRTKMLAGDPSAEMVKFGGETNFLMPADIDGPGVPGGGGLFYTFKDGGFHGGSDRIELFRLNPDFVTPASSTFTLIKTIPVAPFTYTPCGFFILDCIRQMGSTEGLDAVGEWPMHRLAYRRFANREVLVGNFTVGGGAGETGAAIRWFELRKTTGNWKLFQEGTHDPADGHDRFMGSIAIDQKGNIALGYSVSSSTMFPNVRYVTRKPGDPKGTMGPEKTLRAGGGAQTSTFNRWGDYSAMSVDPVTGCQFWYTNEFYKTTSTSTWSTIIGAFTNPNCP